MMNNKRYTRHTKWLALAGIGFWAGCSFFGDDPEQAVPEPEPEFAEAPVESVEAQEVEPMVLHDHIYEIDTELGSKIDFADGVWTIPVDEAGMLADRQVGDVVVFDDVDGQYAQIINHIERRGDHLVLRGEAPDITDVIKHGSFEVYIPSEIVMTDPEDRIVDIGGESGFSQRQQKLSYTHDFSGDIPQPPDYSFDFAHDIFQHDVANASVSVSGGVEFRPAVIAEVTISFSDIAARVELVGEAEAWADFHMEASEAFTYERNFTIPIHEYNFDIDPPILDPFEFTLEAFLRGETRVSGYGSGVYEPEFRVEGSVRAGIEQGLTSGTDTNFDRSLTASADVGGERLDINLEGNLRFGIDAGVTLYRGPNTSGSKLAEAVPFSGMFLADGQIQNNPPHCPYNVKVTVDSYAKSFAPAHTWDRRWVGLDRSGDIPAPGCQSDNDPSQCQEDLDCRDAGSPGANVSGAAMACESGTCVPAADLNISLGWASDANLNLYVMTPGGETLSYANPGPNPGSSGQMYRTSCGGCEGSEADGNYLETAIHDGSTTSDVFYIWVENPDGFHDGSSDSDINFNLNVDHSDVFDETFYGRISGEGGSKSMTYRYTVPVGN